MVKYVKFSKKRKLHPSLESKVISGSGIFANKDTLKVLLFIWKSVYRVKYEQIYDYTFCSENKWKRMRKDFLANNLITNKHRGYFCTTKQQEKVGNIIHNYYTINSISTE